MSNVRWALLAASTLGSALHAEAPPATTAAQSPAPIARFPLLGGHLKLLEAKRTKTWTAAGSGGFSFTTAADGREFIVLRYELSVPPPEDLPVARYSKIEVTNGETFFASETFGRALSETAVAVEQLFSVPLKTTPRALHLGRFVPDPSGGAEPRWASAARIDLSKVSFTAEKK